MHHYVLSALGQDRPGIVAGVSQVLLAHGVNIADSQMTILRGHFTMMLALETPDELDRHRFCEELAGAQTELDFSLSEVELGVAAPEPSHMVSVYGVDHPGIVHTLTSSLAECGADITDLNTRLVEQPGEDALYVMLMEVAVPTGVALDELRDSLTGVAKGEGVEVTLRELERDVL